jgi:two-component system chemotaxis sensor kinase CheA
VDNDFLQDPSMISDFLVESEELLQGMDQDMVLLESTPNDDALLNRIFRALHTIKGTSGFLGFEPLVRLGHQAEDVLNDLRRHEIPLTRRLMDVLLAVRDQLGRILGDIRAGGLKTYDLNTLLADLKTLRTDRKDIDIDIDIGNVARNAPAAPSAAAANPPEAPIEYSAEVSSSIPADAPNEVPQASAVQKEIHPEAATARSAETAFPAKANASVPARPAQSGDPTADVAKTMRVDVRKLDEFINLVGELVLERNRLTRLASDASLGRISTQDLHAVLSQSTGRLSFITEELQTAGLKARMVPIDMVFRKFPRLVRDVARSVQKEVELVVRGEETEIDKTMVELIGDPLVHLIRNSLDHGLESPAVRLAAGKKSQGCIRLEAHPEGDQIVISVSDDGAGIDPSRILSKAIEKGFVASDRARLLSKKEILDFIFLPGFSTAETVNDLSGRGVGMDVVRSNLKRMNGSIEIDSTPGKGTTVLLHLPLTLAILPVLLVQVAGDVYGLPMRSVIETSQMRPRDVHQVEGREVLQLRGLTFPLLRLAAMFDSQPDASARSEKVVILSVGEKRLALAVDHLIGQESTVIKPLGSYLHNCAGIAGATIGGDGRVRLVLDPAGLVAHAGAPAAFEAVR